MFCSFGDPYNVEVKVFLKSEIAASHKGEYTDKQVSGMFHCLLINTLTLYMMHYLQLQFNASMKVRDDPS